MTSQTFIIKDYDWKVYSYYNVDIDDINIILDKFQEINCNHKYVKKAYDAFQDNPFNIGLTYSNYIKKESIVIISKTTSSKQFFNTLIHEINHLQSNIATVYNLNEKGEEVCYLIGKIGELMYDKCKVYLCDNCRKRY